MLFCTRMQPGNGVRLEPARDCPLRGKPQGECRARFERITETTSMELDLGPFDIRRCRDCDLGFTDPRPTEDTVSALYETKDSNDFDRIRDTFIDKLKDALAVRGIRRTTRRISRERVRRVLDFGCGNARFALAAQRVFPDAAVDAVDYQPEPPPLLATPNQRVSYVTVDGFHRASTRYDLIYLRHVLEHSHHPIELLRELGARLDEGGTLYVEVPNLESRCARVFGGAWTNWYVPYHIHHFSRRSLSEALTSAGLTGEIRGAELPLMGNLFARLAGLKKSNVIAQLAGIGLHPVQLLLEKVTGSSTCLAATCRAAKGEAAPVQA